MSDPIYLDYNATTPVDRVVVEAMLPYLWQHFGNPSSAHPYGQRTNEAVEEARAEVAALLGAGAEEIVFTGGGNEANNLAIKGVAHSSKTEGNHFITSAVEHPAVLEPMRFLERHGYRLTVLPVDEHGRIDPAAVAAAIDDDTLLVSVMLANNEVGTLQPIREIAEVAHAHDVLVHTDAAQAIGKVPVDVGSLGVDLLSLTGHKFYVPKGVGALYVRRGVALEPLIHGAGQERGLRAGTENVPYLVGLGRAAELAVDRLPHGMTKVKRLRDELHQRILAGFPEAKLNGHPSERLPNTLNLSFPGIDAATLLRAIAAQVACGTGSACHSGRAEPSSVLLAMGLSRDHASSALRLSLGFATTEEEVDRAASVITTAAHALREETRHDKAD